MIQKNNLIIAIAPQSYPKEELLGVWKCFLISLYALSFACQNSIITCVNDSIL